MAVNHVLRTFSLGDTLKVLAERPRHLATPAVSPLRYDRP